METWLWILKRASETQSYSEIGKTNNKQTLESLTKHTLQQKHNLYNKNTTFTTRTQSEMRWKRTQQNPKLNTQHSTQHNTQHNKHTLEQHTATTETHS
jgi:hypothetical protein